MEFLCGFLVAVWEIVLLVEVILSAKRIKRRLTQSCRYVGLIVQLILLPVCFLFSSNLVLKQIAVFFRIYPETFVANIPSIQLILIILVGVEFLASVVLCVVRIFQARKENRLYAQQMAGLVTAEDAKEI